MGKSLEDYGQQTQTNPWAPSVDGAGSMPGVYKPGVGSYSQETEGGMAAHSLAQQIQQQYQQGGGAMGSSNPTTAANAQQQAQYAGLAAPTAYGGPTTYNPSTYNAQGYGGATVDQSQQNQFRQSELTLAQQLGAQAIGAGPSLARAQLQEATDQNVRQQAGLAALASSGMTPGAARYQIANQGAAIQQSSALQSAELRMAEEMDARQQLAGVLSQGRGADIGLAENQARLAQEAGMFSSAQQNEAGQFNAMAQNQAGQFDTKSQEEMYQALAQQNAQYNQNLTQMQLETMRENNPQAGMQMGLGGASGLAGSVPGLLKSLPSSSPDTSSSNTNSTDTSSTDTSSTDSSGGGYGGGDTSGGGDLSYAARGGVAYKPTHMLIGERGPEAVVPLYDRAKMLAFAKAVNDALGGEKETEEGD